MNFETFNLHPRIHEGIKALGYTEPTPIQNKAIPSVLEGKDVLGLAQTGTGKTAAFALPILERLITKPRRAIRALILAPTRELAEQIRESVGSLGKHTGLRSIALYGGVSQRVQMQNLRKGVEIAVACPGRLLDLLGRGVVDLGQVEMLVLDEADRMCDMGFMPDIKKILRYLPAKRQTLFFSATMPEEIRTLSRDILHAPVTVQAGEMRPVSTVSHALYPVTQTMKTGLLIELLRRLDTESVLVFTRTKHRAKTVARHLEKAGHRAASLQGNLSQNRRREAIDGFRKGDYKVLVATDIAARGIDITQISHVINFDIPDTADAYTHRIGRTGRATRTGDAFTFVAPEDAPIVRDIERVLGAKIERRKLEGFVPAAPMQEEKTSDKHTRSFSARRARNYRK